MKAGEGRTLYLKGEIQVRAGSGEIKVSFKGKGFEDAFVQSTEVIPKGFPMEFSYACKFLSSQAVSDAYITYGLSEAGIKELEQEWEKFYMEALQSGDAYRLGLVANTAFKRQKKASGRPFFLFNLLQLRSLTIPLKQERGSEKFVGLSGECLFFHFLVFFDHSFYLLIYKNYQLPLLRLREIKVV